MSVSISRRLLSTFAMLSAAGLVAAAVPAPTPAFAQQGQSGGGGSTLTGVGDGSDGSTCAWCRVVNDSFYQMDNPLDPESWGWVQYNMHHFPQGEDECGYPQPSNSTCARCGSVSAPCHVDLQDPDHCHIACGGEELARAGAAMEEALTRGDAGALAKLMRTKHEKFAAVFLRDGGRIALNAECDRRAPARQYAVPLAMRKDLERLLAL